MAKLVGGTKIYGNLFVDAGLNAGNLYIANSTASTSTTSGALVVNGGVGVAGSIVAAQLNSTGNVLAQNGILNALTVNGQINSSIISVANILVGAGGFNSNSTVFATNFNTSGNVLAQQFVGSGSLLTALPGYAYSNVNVIAYLAGGITSTGYINTSGNISTAQLNAGQINTTGNVLAQQFVGSGSLLTALPGYAYSNVNVAAYTQTMGYQNFSNVNVAAYLASQGIGGGIYSNVNVAAYTQTMSYTNYSNVNVAAYTQTMGYQNFSNVNVAAYVTSMGVTNYSNVNVIAYLAGGISSTGFINTSGNVSATNYIGGAVNVSGNVLASVIKVGAVESTGIIYANLAQAATSTTTGGLRVAGGMGVIGNIALAGNINLTTAGVVGGGGNILINGVAGTLGQVLTQGGAGVYWATPSAGSAGSVISSGTSNVSVLGSGADVVTTVGGSIVLRAMASNVTILPTTTSTSTTTGALVVNGGVGISGNVNVTGAGTVSVPASINVYATNATGGDAQLTVSQAAGSNDLKLLVAGTDSRSDGLTANDAYIATTQRLNLVNKGNGGTLNTYLTVGASGATAYDSVAIGTALQNGTAAVRVVVDGNGNVLIGQSTPLSYANLTVGHTTPSISPITGAIVTPGGVGIGGNLNVGGNLRISGATVGDAGTNNGSGSLVYIQQTTGWSAAQPWALYVQGYTYLDGFRVYGQGGIRSLYLASGTLGFATGDNTSPITFTTGPSGNTERIRIDGGGAGNLLVGTINPTNFGNLTVGHSTPSTSTTTGAIVTPGGIGAQGNVIAGQRLQLANIATGTGAIAFSMIYNSVADAVDFVFG